MDEEALYGSLVIRLMVFRRRVNGLTKTEAQSHLREFLKENYSLREVIEPTFEVQPQLLEIN